MGEVGSQSDRIARIQRAACRVLEDDSFKRAPVLSQLLEYLVDMTARGVPLKSYTIAIDALGKSAGELGDADTYARVAVARLRKALASHFAAHPAEDEIYIDAGSYEVQIRSPGPTDAPANAEQVVRNGTRSRLLVHLQAHALGYAAACAALILFAAVIHFVDVRRDQARWVTSDFPTLAIVPGSAEDAGRPHAQEQDLLKNALRERLLEYIGFRLIEAGSVQADYEVRLDADVVGSAEVQNIALVETATQRLIWTKQYPYDHKAEIARIATLAATAVAAPGGALNRHGRSKRLSSRSPYGCWLRFTDSVMSYNTMIDNELHRCAADWHAANDSNPVAAFLRNWTMVNDSMTMLRRTSRHAALEQALAVVHQALARDPDNAMLYVAEMRTNSFLGERDQVRQAAKSALAKAPENRAIAGMAATWLTFWNDPAGMEMLGQLEVSSDLSQPWEHAGHFIAAMMRDDVRGAGEHLGQLRFYMEGQPALHLLEAAYAGRSGSPKAAQAALDQLHDHPRAWIVGPDEVMERLPIAPEVKARMEEWTTHRPVKAAH